MVNRQPSWVRRGVGERPQRPQNRVDAVPAVDMLGSETASGRRRSPSIVREVFEPGTGLPGRPPVLGPACLRPGRLFQPLLSVRWFAMRDGSSGKLTATGLPHSGTSRVECMDVIRPRTAGLIAGLLRPAARRTESSPGPWPAINFLFRLFVEPLHRIPRCGDGRYRHCLWNARTPFTFP